jgi:tetratricopeptide (TPR) repeat protein
MVASSSLRVIVGHGPEVMMEAYQRYITPELVATGREGLAHDRAHNGVWQALVDRGILGALTDLLFFVALFYHGIRWLGLMERTRERHLFAALSAGGAAAGLLLPWVAFGRVALIGLGVPVGLLVGIAAYLVVRLFIRSGRSDHQADPSFLLVALLSGVAAHLVETQTGIAVTVTRSHLWTYAALLVVLGQHVTGEEELLRRTSEARAELDRSIRRRRRREEPRPLAGVLSRLLLASSFTSGLLLTAMAFSLVTHRFELADDLATVSLLGAVWLVAGTISTLTPTAGPSEQQSSWLLRFGAYGALSLAVASLPVALHAAALPPSASPGDVIIAHYVAFGALLVAIAAGLLRGRSIPRRSAHAATSWLYVVLTGGVITALVLTSVNAVRANIFFDTAQALVRADRLDSAITFYKRARRLAPAEPRYALFLGRAYLRLARAQPEYAEVGLREAEEALLKAKRLSPIDPEIDGNLGQAYSHGAVLVADTPEEKVDWLEGAVRYYREAVQASPIVQGDVIGDSLISAQMELAGVYAKLGREDEAIQQAEAALELASADRREAIEAFVDTLRDRQ